MFARQGFSPESSGMKFRPAQIKYLLFAVPGRAQPATVGLPASGPVQTENRAGPMLAKAS